MKVRECGNGVRKGHHPKPGKDSVDALLWQAERAGVAFNETHVLKPTGSLAGHLKHDGRYVDANHVTPRADHIG